MWYHALPSAATIFVFASVPYIFIYFGNIASVGNPYQRQLGNKFENHTYLRDMRLGNGDPYKQLGLDCLADDEKSCDCA